MNDAEKAKQYAIANFDLMWCQRYLIAYIELRTPPPKDASLDAWANIKLLEFDGDHNVLDILARSLVTSIVTSYSRPWSNNRALNGRVRLSKKLFLDMAQLFQRENPEERLLPFDNDIHQRVLDMRHKMVAHSDHSEWAFNIDKTDRLVTSRLKDPFTYLTLEDARLLLTNTKSLRSELARQVPR